MRRRWIAVVLVSGLLLLPVLLTGVSALWSGVRSRAPAKAQVIARAAPPAARVEPRAPRPIQVDPAPTLDGAVRCTVGNALEGHDWRVMAFKEGGVVEVEATLERETLVLRPEEGITQAMLVLRGMREDPATIAWTTDETTGRAPCFVSRLPAPLDAPIFGRVKGATDLADGTVFLEGCGARGDDPVDADGTFFVQGKAEPCSMRAWRKAGALRLPGPWVEVNPTSGADVEASLEVPTFEPAGMGIGFALVPNGIGISQVHGGTPAAAAGLETGDVITSVDGVSTAGMETDDFLNHGIGPAGTEVTLEGVTNTGEPFEVTIRREPIVTTDRFH